MGDAKGKDFDSLHLRCLVRASRTWKEVGGICLGPARLPYMVEKVSCALLGSTGSGQMKRCRAGIGVEGVDKEKRHAARSDRREDESKTASSWLGLNPARFIASREVGPQSEGRAVLGFRRGSRSCCARRCQKHRHSRERVLSSCSCSRSCSWPGF
jgi:hypothetical protein